MGTKRTTQPETPTTTPQKRRRTPASSASQTNIHAYFTPTRPSAQATSTVKKPEDDEVPTAVLAGDQFPWWETWPPKHHGGAAKDAGVVEKTADSKSATPGGGSLTQAKLEDLVALRPNVQLEYDSRNGKVWIQQLGANDSFLQRPNEAPQTLGKGGKRELFHNDRFWLLENIEPFDLTIDPVPASSGVGQKRAKPEKEVDEDETTDDEHPPPPPAKKRHTKLRAARKHKRRSHSASGSDDDSYYDPDDPTFVVPDDEDDGEESAGSEVGEEEDENDRPAKPVVCMFGKNCYRRNPAHFQEYAHPWLDDPAGPASRPASTPGPSGFGASSKAQPSSVRTKGPHTPSLASKTAPSGAQSSTDTSRHSSPSKVYNPPSNSTASSSLLAGAPSSVDVKVLSPASLSPLTRDSGSDTPNRFRMPKDYSALPASPTSKPAPSSLAASYAKAFPTQKPLSQPGEVVQQVSDVDPIDRNDTKSASPIELSSTASREPEIPAVQNAVGNQGTENFHRVMSANGHNTPQTVAFPSLATREGQLNLDRAAATFAEALNDVYDTLSSRDISLVLVDEDQDVVAAYNKATGDKPRFRAIQGELSTIFTSSGIKCERIVVETSWRWKTTATAACHRVHNRAGPALIERTRAEYGYPAVLGKIYPVTVPLESALHVEEGIKEPSLPKTTLTSPAIRHASGGSWADALKPYCVHPEKHPDVVVAFNDELVAMKDKFPAKKHYLVMPRADIESLTALDRSHIRLLDAMKAQADELIGQAPGCAFRTGFHAVPSMR
ncbi:hypothetical protein HDU87_001618 [Geranomyces variabilis]|uniref:PBZ-type domain-containing protein n=1 Tax=Geranomyces variabilis TaxID=109894 RepID=A0AAD5TME9_9FUNG|nr:hypothetical protein HDU87_001618 [Geranomyces variabilis]